MGDEDGDKGNDECKDEEFDIERDGRKSIAEEVSDRFEHSRLADTQPEGVATKHQQNHVPRQLPDVRARDEVESKEDEERNHTDNTFIAEERGVL